MGLLLLQKCQLSEKAAVGWTRCLSCNLSCWAPESRRGSPMDPTRKLRGIRKVQGSSGARLGGDARARHCGLKRRLCPTPCRQPWPARAAGNGAATGRRHPGPYDARLSPRSRAGGLQVAALTGTNQKQLRACGAQQSRGRWWRVHRTDAR